MKISKIIGYIMTISVFFTGIFGLVTIAYVLISSYAKNIGLGLTLTTICFIVVALFFNTIYEYMKKQEEKEESRKERLKVPDI